MSGHYLLSHFSNNIGIKAIYKGNLGMGRYCVPLTYVHDTDVRSNTSADRCSSPGLAPGLANDRFGLL
jgi:hypothetical protein